MAKALKEWAFENTEEVIVQTRISLANTDQVRTSPEPILPPFGQTFTFSEDKNKFKKKSWLDFSFVGKDLQPRLNQVL